MKDKVNKIRELLDQMNYCYRARKSSTYAVTNQKILDILKDLEKEIDLIHTQKICPFCGGTGKVKYPDTDDDVTCHKCQGRGYQSSK